MLISSTGCCGPNCEAFPEHQEKIVFGRRFRIDVLVHVKLRPLLETFGQGLFELLRYDILLETEVHDRIRRRVEDVIGLLLRQHLAEILADILALRMTLDREVAAVEVVEVVHTDRKFVAVETVPTTRSPA